MPSSWIPATAAMGLALAAGCGGDSFEEIRADPASIQATPIVASAAGDWPWWRGPGLDGMAVGETPPLQWGENENIIWKAPLPGEGHASPIVVGDRVLVSFAESAPASQSLLCLNRDTGEEKWRCEIHRGKFAHAHAKNSQASSTPASDGERVYNAFLNDDALWVTAVDLQGEIVWRTKAGPFQSLHGFGSSPVLHRSLVIVAGDNPGGSFLTALERKTGKVAWRVKRPANASFATPVIARAAGKTQLLISGHDHLDSYDPNTGEKIWSSLGPAMTTANTVAWNDSLVFATGGYPDQNIMAIKADGSGISWRVIAKSYVPSPILIDDKLLVCRDDGVLLCLDAASGKKIWRERLGGGFSASPVVSGEYVFLPNESGKMFVFRAGDKFESVAENSLPAGGLASPVICGGKLFIRARGHLYCVGN